MLSPCRRSALAPAKRALQELGRPPSTCRKRPISKSPPQTDIVALQQTLAQADLPPPQASTHSPLPLPTSSFTIFPSCNVITRSAAYPNSALCVVSRIASPCRDARLLNKSMIDSPVAHPTEPVGWGAPIRGFRLLACGSLPVGRPLSGTSASCAFPVNLTISSRLPSAFLMPVECSGRRVKVVRLPYSTQ